MMQYSWNSLPVTPRILRRAREFPRIFPGFSEKVRRHPGLEHTTPIHGFVTLVAATGSGTAGSAGASDAREAEPVLDMSQ